APGAARAMIHANLRRSGAKPFDKHANETVHLAIEPKLLDDFSPIEFQRASQIAKLGSGNATYEPVRNPRWQPPQDESILALPAIACDEIQRARFHHFDHARDVRRI